MVWYDLYVLTAIKVVLDCRVEKTTGLFHNVLKRNVTLTRI